MKTREISWTRRFLRQKYRPGTFPSSKDSTLFPRIHRHAVIYETAYFWKRTSGFGYIAMSVVIRGLQHAVISET